MDTYFQAKVLIHNSKTGALFKDLPMKNNRQGSLSLNVSPTDTSMVLIVGSMPEVFKDVNPKFQLFSYEIKISVK